MGFLLSKGGKDFSRSNDEKKLVYRNSASNWKVFPPKGANEFNYYQRIGEMNKWCRDTEHPWRTNMNKSPWDSDIAIDNYSLIPDLRWCPCKPATVTPVSLKSEPCFEKIDRNGDHNW